MIMECLKRNTVRRIICLLMAVMMVIGFMPGIEANAASEGGKTVELSTGEQIFALDEKAPKDISKYPDDVYGVDTTQNLQGAHHEDENNNTPFLLSRQSELALLVGDNGSDVMYRMDNIKMDQTALSDGIRWVNGVNVANSTNSSMPESKLEIYKDLYYPQSVAFDRDGTGRDQYIATVGLFGRNVTLAIQDARSGSLKTILIQEANWMGNIGSGGDWLKDNYFAITAGDYDGDGKDSVIVYVCGDGDNVRIEEYTYKDEKWSGQTILKLSDILKETTFNETDGYDMKFKPVVSLTTGDFDGDGSESFAYSAGYYNTSDSKADGYRSQPANNLERFATVVQVYDKAGDKWSPYEPVWMYDRAAKAKEQDKTTGYKKYEITYMHAGVIGAGDVDGDGIDDIVAAGYTDHNYSDHSSRYAKAIYDKSNQLVQVDDIYNYSSNKQYVTSVISKNKDGKFVKTELKRTPMSTAQGYTWAKYCNDKDFEYAKLCIACGTTNGNNHPEDVFISGIVYDFSKYSPTVKYTPGIMDEQLSKTSGGNKKDSSVNWIRNVAAGNFSGNDAGREQFVFTLWQKTYGEEKYSANVGAVTGVEFDDKKKDNVITSYGEPEGYACSLSASEIVNHNYPVHGTNKEASQLMYSAVSSNAICAVPVAVDIDDDGLMGRFRSNGYVYTDPEVLAVLQAGPYFSELDALGGYEDPCGTAYSISFGYENGTSSSDNVSFEAGFAGEVGGPGFKTSLELGYAMDYSKSYESSYSVETTYGWTADKKDIVVISRIPQLVYTYDIWDAEKEQWVIDGYNVKVPLSQRYFMLGISDYNDFVEDYNALVGEDGYKLKEIVMGEDLPGDHVGIPDNYWKNWAQAGNGNEQLSSTTWTLGYDSGAPEFSYSSSGSKTESQEISHGFHYSLTMQGGGEFGVGEAWAGGYVNLDYSHSTGSFTTKTNTTTSGAKVQNLNLDNLMDAGMTVKQVKQYGFSWEFGRWTRVMVEDGPLVPFYGYVVTGLKRLPGPPRISGAEKINLEEGYKETSRPLSVSGEPDPEVTKVSGDEKITVTKNNGAYDITIAPGLELGTYDLVLKAENENGSSEFECSVVVKKGPDRLSAEKVSKMIRNLILYDLENEAMYDDEGYGVQDYNKAKAAYDALTDEQKAFITDADRQKLDAAKSLIELGHSRRYSRDEADQLREKIDDALNNLEQYTPDDETIAGIKEDSYVEYSISELSEHVVTKAADAYEQLVQSSGDAIYLFLTEQDGLSHLDDLKDRFEKLMHAYNMLKDRETDEAIWEAYDNNEKAKQFDEKIDAAFYDPDRNWNKVRETLRDFNTLMRTDCETMSLLRSRENMFEAIRYELETGSYENAHAAEQYRELGDQADQATDVAALIDSLPKGDALRASDKGRVKEAKEAYARLSDDQKNLLGSGTLSLLKSAEEKLQQRLAEIVDISKDGVVKRIVDKVYTGKALTQSPLVQIGYKVLHKGEDYTVEYKNNTKVGKASIVITGTGNYKGTITKTFTINPKPTSLKKPKALKKGFLAKWKAQKAEVTGYKLQYSLKKNFKKAKTVTIKKNKTVSKKVTKLKGRKKYYIRIRTYKKVGKTTYLSKWSKAKSVKTKK